MIPTSCCNCLVSMRVGTDLHSFQDGMICAGETSPTRKNKYLVANMYCDGNSGVFESAFGICRPQNSVHKRVLLLLPQLRSVWQMSSKTKYITCVFLPDVVRARSR